MCRWPQMGRPESFSSTISGHAESIRPSQRYACSDNRRAQSGQMFGHVFSWPQRQIGISGLKLQVIILQKEPFPHQFSLCLCNLCLFVWLFVNVAVTGVLIIAVIHKLWLHQSFHHPRTPRSPYMVPRLPPTR